MGEERERFEELVEGVRAPCSHPLSQADYMGQCMLCGATPMQIRSERRDDVFLQVMRDLTEAIQAAAAALTIPDALR